MKTSMLLNIPDRHAKAFRFFEKDITSLNDQFFELVERDARLWKTEVGVFFYKDISLIVKKGRGLAKRRPERDIDKFEEIYQKFEKLKQRVEELTQYFSILSMSMMDPAKYAMSKVTGVSVFFNWNSDEHRIAALREELTPGQFSFIEYVENAIHIDDANKVINNI